MSNTMTEITEKTKESLFQIGEHFYALESLILDNEGEIDEAIDQWLEEYHAKEADKIDAYCYLIQKFQEISEEAKRLADRSRSYNMKVKGLKVRLKYYLERRGRDKIETSRFTVAVQQNGGKQPIMIFEGIEPENMPDQYVRIYREPDMDEIRQSLLNNDQQAKKFAQLMPRGTHLRIK